MEEKGKKQQRNLNKEKLFQASVPRSRVQLNIVREIEAKIAELPEDLPAKIITYQEIIRKNGEYYLLSESELDLKPLSAYLEQNSIKMEKLLAEYKELLLLLKDRENIPQLFPEGINAANFWLDGKENIYLLPEAFLRLRLNYNQLELQPPAKEYFRPPEIIKGGNWDQKAYIFNLTAVFYYFLSGRTIFRDQDRAKVLNKIQQEKVLELKVILPQISDRLNQLISQGLRKDPAQRGGVEKLAAETEAAISENNFKLTSFLAREKLLDTKSLARKKRRENIKLFFRQSWKLILFFSLLGGTFIWGLLAGPQPVVTSQNTAEEVVNYFYQGLADKNITLIKETAVFDLGSMERIINESHVVEKMQNAYSNNSAAEEKTNKVYSLEKLKIEAVSTAAKKASFRSFYEFNFRDRSGIYSAEISDKLFLEKIDGSWQITAVEGGFSKMINGNYPWEE